MGNKVSAPLSISRRSKRRAEQIRRVRVAGREFRDVAYKPQFAIGIVCRDEADQQKIFQRVGRFAAGRDVKVLVL